MGAFQRLYKDRYMIAVYGRDDDVCYGVFDNIEQLQKSAYVNAKRFKGIISRAIRLYKSFPNIMLGKYCYCFIDVFEQHDDCFAEEDKIFLDYYKKEKKLKCAENYNIPKSSFFRAVRQYKKEGFCKYEKQVIDYLEHKKDTDVIRCKTL